jgi:hypothetical protein
MGARLHVLSVSGTPYEMGRQHGSRFATEIRTFLRDGLARVNPLRGAALSYVEATEIVAGYVPWIEDDLPDVADEVRGLADGAGITYGEAMLLQLRRELILHPGSCCDCTSVGCFDEQGRAVLAQNVDLAGGMENYMLVMRCRPTDPERPCTCLFTFMGLCGYLGINSAGLAIGLTMVRSGGWRPGVPPYLLVRHLLNQDSLAAVLAEIRRVRRASSRYLLISDGESIVGVEMTVDDVREITGVPLVHTNHFIHPDFLTMESFDAESLEGSHRRAAVLTRLISQGESIASILSNHEGYPRSICAHSLGAPTRTDTVGSVLLYPGSGELHVLAGHPCQGAYSRISVARHG